MQEKNKLKKLSTMLYHVVDLMEADGKKQATFADVIGEMMARVSHALSDKLYSDIDTRAMVEDLIRESERLRAFVTLTSTVPPRERIAKSRELTLEDRAMILESLVSEMGVNLASPTNEEQVAMWDRLERDGYEPAYFRPAARVLLGRMRSR